MFSKRNYGFTLIEVITVLLVVGVLAAIAVPSFLEMLNRRKIENATIQARAALQEAQREAIRRHRSCTVNVINVGEFKPDGKVAEHPTLQSDCLILGDRTLEGVHIRKPNNLSTINFAFRGTTQSSGTIVFYIPNTYTQQQCLAIAPGLGIMRTGTYSNQDFTGFSASNCRTRQ